MAQNGQTPHAPHSQEALTPAERIHLASSGPPSHNACVTCYDFILITPLRYGVIGAQESEVLQKLTPDLPEHLGANRRPELEAATNARYGIRLMRPGYLYFFASRLEVQGYEVNAQWQLDGLVACQDTGHFRTIGRSRFIAAQPGSLTLQVKKPLDIQEWRILFTPSRLSDERINAILNNQGGLRERIQQFDIRRVLNDPELNVISARPHDILRRDEIHQYTAEMLALGMMDNPDSRLFHQRTEQTRGIHVIHDQLYCNPLFNDDFYTRDILNIQDTLDAGALRNKAHGIGVVLDDPIGITQELNNWSHDALENRFYVHYLNREVPLNTPEGVKPVTSERLIRALNAFENVRDTYSILRTCGAAEKQWGAFETAREEFENRWRSCMANISVAKESLEKNPDDKFARRFLNAWEQARDILLSEERPGGLAYLENRQEELRRALMEASRQQEALDTEFEENYTPLVDQDKFAHIKQTYQQEWEKAQALRAPRAAAHLRWLTGQALLEAFGFYDPSDVPSGVMFAHEAGLCMMACEGDADAYEQIINVWWNPSTFQRRENLAIRAYCFNQPEIIQAVVDLEKQSDRLEYYLNDHPEVSLEAMTDEERNSLPQFAAYAKQLRAVAKGFSVVLNYRLPEFVGNLLGQRNARVAGTLATFQQGMAKLLALGGQTNTEFRLFRYYRDILVAQLGNEILADKVAASGVPGKRQLLSQKLMRNWNVLTDSKTHFGHVRMAGIVSVAEAVYLMALVFKGNKQPEDALRIYGALMTTVGSLVNYGATLMERLLGGYKISPVSAATRQGSPVPVADYRYHATHIRYARWKLAGASLSACGAIPVFLMEARLALRDAIHQWEERNWLLLTGYGFNVTLNVVFAGSSAWGSYSAVRGLMTALGEKSAYDAAVLGTAEAAGSRSVASAALSRAMAFGRVFNPLTPYGVLFLVVTFAIAYGVQWAQAHQDYELRRWLSRFILRTANTDLLEQKTTRYYDGHDTCIESREPYKIYSDMEEEQRCFRLSLITLTKGVPPDIFQQEFIAELGILSQQEQTRPQSAE